MGLIKAVAQAVGGSFADQWLEVIEPDDMGDQTVFTRGVLIRRGQNTKGTDDTVSNGSIIHVYDNQFMMLVDGGKIVDYTAEPGYYKVDNSSLPSLFNGQLKDTLKDSFARIKFGGQTPDKQKVFFINLQEIKGIKFGTRNPINYFDNFYNAELFLRAHGTYSIKIVDPIRFYAEAIPRNKDRVEITDINEQYISEFLEALQTSINQLSADGVRISYVSSKGRELSKYMSETLDEEWNQMRGMEIQAVGIAYASRQTYTAGFAIRQTALLLKERILDYAHELTRMPAYNLDIVDGNIQRITDGRVLMPLSELALEALYSVTNSKHLTAESTAQIKSNAYSFGCTIAEVEVDIPMCKVKLLNIVNAHDAGRLINPALAEAQVHGGMSMGIGFGMSERMMFDEKTGKVLNNNLLDYKLSTFMDHPRLKAVFVENPEPTSAFGTKALGEPPTCSIAPAIRNAVYQATGVSVNEAPVNPHNLFRRFTEEGIF